MAQDDASREIFAQKYPSFLVAKTDVTSFYEYVDVNILMEDLAGLTVQSWAIETLDKFLRAFNELNHAWGLPQGSDASGILANLYLLPVDRVIIQAGLDHVRYSDDIYLFGNDWLKLRKVLLEITQMLRSRHLSLSHGKTRIIPSGSILAEFQDAEKDAINYGVSNFPEQAPASLHDYFDRTTAKEPVNNRDLRFILSKLRQIDDDYAVPWLLSNMGEIPHLAREALAYLDHFCESTPGIGRSLVELLVNDKVSIYPFAEQHLLACMIRHGVKDSRASREAWNILLDRNKESFVRELAARYIGRYPQLGDGGRLRQQFQREFDKRVQRALLVACYETGQCSEHWLRAVAARPTLEITARYLLDNPVVPVPWVDGAWAAPKSPQPIMATSGRTLLSRSRTI